MIYLCGFHAMEEWIKAGKPAHTLLVAKPGPRSREIMKLAQERKIRIERAGTFDLDRLSPGHRGLVLEVEDLSREEISFESFIASVKGKEKALVFILDEITDPHNYGAILRSCDQFAVDLVVSGKRRNAKHADVILKTSSGTSSWVPQAETANLVRAVDDLKEAGFWVYGADMTGEPAYSIDLSGRVAIILGSEGTGISRLLRENCDAMIAVPTLGRIDSLNVSVAAGILLYEVIRQRKC